MVTHNNSAPNKKRIYAGVPPLRQRRPSTYSARLLGRVNNSTLRVTGRGAIEQNTGRVHGHYTLEQLPEGLHPRLLNAVMVTGYPSVCQETAEAPNPFAAGSYTYTRSLDFGDRGKISYTATCHDIECDSDASWLDSEFEIRGNVELPILIATTPLIETWTPIGGRRIDGCFTMAWQSDTGDHISAVARTEYLIPEGSVLPSQVLYRYIDLKNKQVDNVLEIDQCSRLISEDIVRKTIYRTV